MFVERAYTYVGKHEPTLFFYHPKCWACSAPPALAKVEDGV